MATIVFGPYRPQSIAQLKHLAAQVSALSPIECQHVISLLDLSATVRPEPREWR